MDLRPIARRSVADALHDQLLDAILDGTTTPGSTLPSERELSAAAGVNRQAVREALQRLRQADLVEIVHGGGVRVLDWRRTAGLALLPDLLVRGEGLDPDVGRSIMQLRVIVGADAARLCAERSEDETLEILGSLVDEMDATGGDAEAWGTLGWRFWEAVVDGSRNIAYRLAFNTMRAVAEAVAPQLGTLLGSERTEVEHFHRVVDAIALRDGDAAADAATHILHTGQRVAADLRRA